MEKGTRIKIIVFIYKKKKMGNFFLSYKLQLQVTKKLLLLEAVVFFILVTRPIE